MLREDQLATRRRILWDVATHRQLGPPLTQDDVNCVAFSPGGRLLASGSTDGTVRLCDVASHRQLGAPLTGHTGYVTSVAFSPDGSTLASGSQDATIRLWTNYPVDLYIHQLCGYINRQQAERVWKQAEPSIPYQPAC